MSTAKSSDSPRRRKSTATYGKSNAIAKSIFTDFLNLTSKCRADSNGRGIPDCEQDACLSDLKLIDSINHETRSLGWTAYNYQEFFGRKLKEGMTYRLGTFEPRIRVKSMSRLSNKLESLPKTFNALDSWTGQISEVVDQGWCG
jgi:hypothetical protein